MSKEKLPSFTKNEFLQELAERTGLSFADAERAINTSAEIIEARLQSGYEVNLPPLGKFAPKERAARKGRNPQTGEVIEIAATVVPEFKPSTRLKEAVK